LNNEFKEIRVITNLRDSSNMGQIQHSKKKENSIFKYEQEFNIQMEREFNIQMEREFNVQI